METPTKLIVGLGNPGREYEGTRHNIGFDLIDLVAKQHQVTVNKSANRALIGEAVNPVCS